MMLERKIKVIPMIMKIINFLMLTALLMMNVKIINMEKEIPNLATIRLTEVLKVGKVMAMKIWMMKEVG